MKALIHRLTTPLRAAGRFVRNCWTECPKHEKCTLLVMSALLNFGLGIMLLQGCATTPKGLTREQQLYNTATNVVAAVQQVTPFLPPPVSTPVGIILGGVSAALAAWNVHQQRTLSALKKARPAEPSPSVSSPGLPPPPVPSVTGAGAPSAG
jgi:hypothetical protein